MVRNRQSTLCRTEKLKGAVLPESTVDAGSGFFFFCEHFFLFTEKEKKRKMLTHSTTALKTVSAQT